MRSVGVEAFLRFWSHYNTLIIEILIGLILLTVVYLAFRTFFGPEEETAGGVGHELNPADLEKTLQKILERQERAPAPAAPQDSAPAASAEGGVPAVGASDEVARLRSQLAERDQQIADIKAAASAPASAGLADDEKKTYEDRLKDLEARLAEYEIISEDIADLSFYKEENSKLQKEISSLKEKNEAAPASEPPPEPSKDPIADLGLDPQASPASPEEAPAPVAEAAPAAAPAPTPSAPAATTEAAPLPKAEEAELMNQFENFVKKG